MAFKDMFSFLFQRSTSEERVAEYVIREHDRGRSLHDILEDKYVVNRLPSQEQRDRLLDRPEHVSGSDRQRKRRGGEDGVSGLRGLVRGIGEGARDEPGEVEAVA